MWLPIAIFAAAAIKGKDLNETYETVMKEYISKRQYQLDGIFFLRQTQIFLMLTFFMGS